MVWPQPEELNGSTMRRQWWLGFGNSYTVLYYPQMAASFRLVKYCTSARTTMVLVIVQQNRISLRQPMRRLCQYIEQLWSRSPSSRTSTKTRALTAFDPFPFPHCGQWSGGKVYRKPPCWMGFTHGFRWRFSLKPLNLYGLWDFPWTKPSSYGGTRIMEPPIMINHYQPSQKSSFNP